MTIADHPDFDNHEMVLYCTDKSSGLRAFIAIHSTVLGAGMGGCRMKTYASETDALSDVLRLSRGMSYKYAASKLKYGGAKAVIIDTPDGGQRQERLTAFARIVENLAGLYTTAEDAGISTEDVRLMATATRFIRNLPLEETGDGALCTAWGVFHGMRAGLEHRGMSGFARRKIAIEGLGKVGMALCALLKDAGAELFVYDIDHQKMDSAREQFGATPVAAGEIYRMHVDVYSPCALGATLNPTTIPEIGAAIVAGAANNQLSDPSQDLHLWERGITYCPDYVVNAGGVLSVADKGVAFNREDALKRVFSIYDTTHRVLAQARRDNIPTGVAADHLARQQIDRFRADAS